MRAVFVLFLCLPAASWSLFGQLSVAPDNATPATVVPNERLTARVLALVPLVGTGKPDDPIRPMFALSPKDLMAPSRAPTGSLLWDHGVALCAFRRREVGHRRIHGGGPRDACSAA